MHLQITHKYMKYKSLKYSCSIHINFSNNNKTKGCDRHSFYSYYYYCVYYTEHTERYRLRTAC